PPASAYAAPEEDAGPGGPPAPAPKKNPTLTIITYSGSTQLLANTSSDRFKVTLTLPDGSTKDVTGDVTWDASDGAISVNSAGYVDVQGGQRSVTLTATHDKTGATGSITLAVVARKLQRIIITPRNPMVEVGHFTPLRARGEYSDNTNDDITFIVSWESRK